MPEPKPFAIEWNVTRWNAYNRIGNLYPDYDHFRYEAETNNLPSFLRFKIEQTDDGGHYRVIGLKQAVIGGKDIYEAMHVTEALILDDLKMIGVALFNGNGLPFYGDRENFKATPAEQLRQDYALPSEDAS